MYYFLYVEDWVGTCKFNGDLQSHSVKKPVILNLAPGLRNFLFPSFLSLLPNIKIENLSV